MVRIFRHGPTLYRELVDATRTYSRSGLAAEDKTLRKLAIVLHVPVRTIVEAWHIKHSSDIVIDHCSRLVHTHCHRSCRVFSVADLLEPEGYLGSLVARPLIRNLVTDAPHHYCRTAPVMSDQIDKVLLRPLLKIEIIAILDLRSHPAVESLSHEHHSHLIAYPYEFWRRHIVGCSDGIAAHILQHAHLSADSSLIRYRAERSEIMVVADTFKYSLYTVKEETLIRPELNCADSESCFNLVNESLALINSGLQSIQIRGFRCP